MSLWKRLRTLGSSISRAPGSVGLGSQLNLGTSAACANERVLAAPSRMPAAMMALFMSKPFLFELDRVEIQRGQRLGLHRFHGGGQVVAERLLVGGTVLLGERVDVLAVVLGRRAHHVLVDPLAVFLVLGH